MKQLITLMMLLVTVAALAQGTRTLEIKKVEEQSPIDSDTRLMVWDSLNYGKVNYTKIGDLIALFGGGGLSNPLTEDLNAGGYEINNVSNIVTNDIEVTGGGVFSEIDVDNITVNDALNIDGNPIYNASLVTVKNPVGQTADVDNYSFETINGNLILKANGGSNGSSTPVLTVNRNTLQTGFGNYEFPRQDGTAGQVFMTDGSGQVTWQSVGSSLDQEEVEDIVGGMVASSPQEGIAVTYDDVNGELGFILDAAASEITYDNSGSSLVATNVKTALDELDDKIPSSQLPYVTVNDSTYTMLEADILASKSYLIKAYRADGITPVDTVTVTYPTITHDGSLLVSSFANISGSSIKVIPDTDVVDYRYGTKKQYTTTPDLQGYVSISSVAQDSIWGSSNDWVINDYSEVGLKNLIVNSTFDDSTNLTLQAAWTISAGTANYDRTANQTIIFDLNDTLNASDVVTLTLDVSNITRDGARIFVYEGSGTGGQQMTVTSEFLLDGTDQDLVLNHTIVGNGITTITIMGTNNNNGGEFSIDNIELIKN